MKKQSKYGQIKKILHDFDMFKSPANLRINEQPFSSQYITGVFSILLFGFFIFAFVSELTKVVNYQSIQSVQTTERISDLTASKILFSFCPAWEQFEGWNKRFRVEAEIVTSNDEKQYYVQKIQLQQCRRQQWVNFTNIFDEYSLGEGLCVKQPQKITILGTDPKKQLKYIRINLKRCNQSQSSFQSPCWDEAFFLDDLRYLERGQFNFYSLFIVDTSISADKYEPKNQYVRLNYDFYYTKRTTQIVNIHLGVYSIKTDVNFFPFDKTQVLQGYYVDQKIVEVVDRELQRQTQNYTIQPIYGQVNIYMTDKKRTFTRKIGKVDEVISYAGGLFGIVIGIFAFILESYPQYHYELKVAQSSFNYDKHGNKLMQKDFNFLRYMQFIVYDWIKFLFCYQIDWKYGHQKDQTRQQCNIEMDVMNLYRKIQIFQIILSYISNKQELKLFYLTKPPTLQETKNKRRGLQYYNKIIGGKIAINIQDIKTMNQSLRQYNKDLYLINSRKGLTSLKGLPTLNLLANQNQSHQRLEQLIREQLVREDKSSDSRFQIKRTDSIQICHIDLEIGNQAIQKNQQKIYKQPKTKQEQEKDEIKEKFQKYSGIESAFLIDKISEYIQIAKQARSIQLSPAMKQIQLQFAETYQSLNPSIRKKIMSKIPLKILHRLTDCLMQKQKKKQLLESFTFQIRI